MKDQLAKILGLPADVTEEQIIEAVEALKKAKTPQPQVLQAPKPTDREIAIRKKIEASHGALNYEQAAMAVDHQIEANKKATKKRK